MEIPTLVFVGGVAVAVIVAIVLAIIVRSQRAAAHGFAAAARARTAWAKMRPKIADQLADPSYRQADAGGRTLIGLGGQVGRIVTLQLPFRITQWAGLLPDADIHAVKELIDAHQELLEHGTELEEWLRRIVQTRAPTQEAQRIMTQAFRRTVLGHPEDETSRRLIDPNMGAARRASAEVAVAHGIALVDAGGMALGQLTELYVQALWRAEEAYASARALLRPS